jgi:hypothetical protein
MSGTKRTRIPRTPTPGLITSQVVELYRHARMLQARVNCGEIDRQIAKVPEAEREVDRMLGLKLSALSTLLIGPRTQMTFTPSFCGKSRPIELSAT